MKTKERVSQYKYGFTLLEILIAVAILSLVLSMCYTILVATLNTRKWVQESTEVDRVGNRLIEIIVCDLQSVYMYQVEGPCLIGKKGRQGGEIDLVTNTDSLVSSRDVESDLCEVGYFLETNRNERGMNWLVRREDFYVDGDITKGGNSIRLYDRIADFQLQFYNEKGLKEKSWNSKEKKGLPTTIEVTLAIPDVPSGSSAELMRENIRYFKAYVPVMVSCQPPEMEKKENEKKKQDKQSEERDL